MSSHLQPSNLIDRFDRRIDYLRLSVTDRCDFRCVYCMAEDMTFLPRSQILSLEQLYDVAAAFVATLIAAAFVAAATGPAAKKAAWTEFIQARKWGVSGFPALIVRDGTELALVTQGWAPTEPLVEAVTTWLETRGDPLDGEACAIDEPGC